MSRSFFLLALFALAAAENSFNIPERYAVEFAGITADYKNYTHYHYVNTQDSTFEEIHYEISGVKSSTKSWTFKTNSTSYTVESAAVQCTIKTVGERETTTDLFSDLKTIGKAGQPCFYNGFQKGVNWTYTSENFEYDVCVSKESKPVYFSKKDLSKVGTPAIQYLFKFIEVNSTELQLPSSCLDSVPAGKLDIPIDYTLDTSSLENEIYTVRRIINTVAENYEEYRMEYKGMKKGRSIWTFRNNGTRYEYDPYSSFCVGKQLESREAAKEEFYDLRNSGKAGVECYYEGFKTGTTWSYTIENIKYDVCVTKDGTTPLYVYKKDLAAPEKPALQSLYFFHKFDSSVQIPSDLQMTSRCFDVIPQPQRNE